MPFRVAVMEENSDAILFSHRVILVYKKLEGLLLVTNSAIRFESLIDGVENVLLIPFKNIEKDQYSSATDPIPMMRLTLLTNAQPVVFKFVGPTEDSSNLRLEMEKLKPIIKEKIRSALAMYSVNKFESEAKAILNKMKMSTLEQNKDLDLSYRYYVLDPNSPVYSDEEFWYNNGVGYSKLNELVTVECSKQSNDKILSEVWRLWLSLNKRASTQSLAPPKATLIKGKLSSLTSDKCLSMNPVNGEIKMSLTSDIIEHIFLMCKYYNMTFDKA